MLGLFDSFHILGMPSVSTCTHGHRRDGMAEMGGEREREGAKFCQVLEKGAFGCTGWKYGVVPMQENTVPAVE